MAQRVTVILEDDLDGGPADQTVRFAVGGAAYEIDLSKKNAAAFRKQLAPFIEHARKAGRAQPVGPPAPRRAVSAAATSGPGPTSTASRSAAAGGSRRAWWSSTRPRPRDVDPSNDRAGHEAAAGA